MFYHFKHPATILVAGPSFCGKTTFLKNVLSADRCLHMFNVFFLRTLWCYGEDAAKPSIENIEYHKGLPDNVELQHPGPQLIILDDLMGDVYNKRISDVFTKDSHHHNVSIIVVSQNIFYQTKHSRTISLNTKYMVLFKNPRDRSQFNHIARQVFPENPKELIRVYNECTTNAYSYFIIDLTQDINDFLRFRTDIFHKSYLAVCFANINGGAETETVENEQAYVIRA